MHIHILGICGTFMGGVAALATEAGHEVTGSDRQVYPPVAAGVHVSALVQSAALLGWDHSDIRGFRRRWEAGFPRSAG